MLIVNFRAVLRALEVYRAVYLHMIPGFCAF